MMQYCVKTVRMTLGAFLLGALGYSRAAETPQQPDAEALLNVPVTGNPMGEQERMPKNPYANDESAVPQGQALFHSMNCDGCHAPEGGGGMGPPLSDKDWIYGAEPAQIYLSIAQGRPQGMPSWGQVLPPASIWYIVRYVQSLSDQDAATGGVATRPAGRTP